MRPRERVKERADYGIDAPHVVLALSAGGLACLLLALFGISALALLSDDQLVCHGRDLALQQ